MHCSEQTEAGEREQGATVIGVMGAPEGAREEPPGQLLENNLDE